MDYFSINNKEVQELAFDMREINTAFKNRVDQYQTKEELNHLGSVCLKSKKKGSVYLTEQSYLFNQDTIIKIDEGINNICLFLKRKGKEGYSINKNTKITNTFSPNSNGLFFMHENHKEEKIITKNNLVESTSLHLPIEYFENLANCYPELFSNSFIRYQKGESFYLNDNFNTTTPQMYGILEQIENSQLMGVSNNAYTDAKVLELLILQFNQSDSSYSKEDKHCKTTSDFDKIHEAEFILLSDIHNPPSIRDLSLRVGINEKKLKYGFKEVYNNTIYGHLFDYKMLLAQKLLQDSSKPITEIAMQCGYSYPSHFCTAFKRRYGMSPSSMR